MNTLAEVDRRSLVSARGDETVRHASQHMSANGVGTLVIVDDAGCPVGIVTDRDIVTRCVAQELSTSETRLVDVMTPRVRTIQEDVPIEFALRSMADAEVRRLVVVDDYGRAVGILSLDDVMQHMVGVIEEVGWLLEGQKPVAPRALTLPARGSQLRQPEHPVVT